MSQRRCKYIKGDCSAVTEPTARQCLACTCTGMAENIKALAKLLPENERGETLLLILERLAASVKGLRVFIEQNYPDEVKKLRAKTQPVPGGEQVGSTNTIISLFRCRNFCGNLRGATMGDIEE